MTLTIRHCDQQYLAVTWISLAPDLLKYNKVLKMSKFKGTLFYAPTNINHANASANSCRSSSKQAKDQIQILWAMIKLQSKLKAVSRQTKCGAS